MFTEKLNNAVLILVVFDYRYMWGQSGVCTGAGSMLTGTVKDSSGAVIPNAQVAITDVGHRITRNAFRLQLGILYSPNLLPEPRDSGHGAGHVRDGDLRIWNNARRKNPSPCR